MAINGIASGLANTLRKAKELLKPKPTGDLVWKCDVSEPVYGHDKAYIRVTNGELGRIDVMSDTEFWIWVRPLTTGWVRIEILDGFCRDVSGNTNVACMTGRKWGRI